MVNIYPDEAERTRRAPTKNGQPKPLWDWTLADLLRVAKGANWLPAALNLDDDGKTRKARIGDYAEVARMVRNLIHPARHRRSIIAARLLLNISSTSLKTGDQLGSVAARNLDERTPHTRSIDFGLAGRQCFGLMREGEELLPSDEQVGDDAGRAAVKTWMRRLLAIFALRRAHPDAPDRALAPATG